MSEKNLTARAMMQVTIEVRPGDTWGEECKMDQVYSQGAESAMGVLREMMRTFPSIRVVGDPKMHSLIVERK